MTTAYLGLGSNLGDRLAFLEGAVSALAATEGMAVTAVSRVYETAPVGGPEQGPYLNAVAAVETELGPADLLVVARRIEEDAQRVRTERWGARTLDVDILLVGNEHVDTPELTVPHPRMWQRGFVLAPLADVAPDLVDVPAGGWPGVDTTESVLQCPPESICSRRRLRTGSMNTVPNQLLRGATALFSIGAGVLHWDIWANHGYRETPARELIIASAVIGVAFGLVAFLNRRWAGLPAVAANAAFLLAFALSRVTELPTLHGGWSESGLAPDSAMILGVSTTLALVVAEALAVLCGVASIVLGRGPRPVALPNEVVRPAY